MHILHLFSNWKWTGPAEPAVLIASAAAAAGEEVRFMCGDPRGEDFRFVRMASSHGIEVETPLMLVKHRRLAANISDTAALKDIIADWQPDVIHCHMINDTRIALHAVGSARSPIVVRTVYDGSPDDVSGSDPTLLRKTQGIITAAESVARWLPGRLKTGGGRIRHIDTPVDLKRFDPEVNGRILRRKWNVPEGSLLIGLVARIQKKRKFDLLFSAFTHFLQEEPEAMLAIVGRGTRKDVVVDDPIHDLGLTGNTVVPGYLEGRDYVEALAAFDALVFLVPGTDGSCRTVREAMSMSLPVITSRRGMLPELVEDGITGVTCDENPSDLCDAFERVLGGGPDERRKMGWKGRYTALEKFSPEKQAEAVTEFYETLLGN